MSAHWAQWIASLQSRPSISRFNVKSIAELASTATRRAAVADAVEQYLLRAYESWRSVKVAHNADVKLLHDIETSLRGEVSQVCDVFLVVSVSRERI